MTASSNNLLAGILAAHGGIERWRAHKGLSSAIKTGGGLWAYKAMPLESSPRRVTTEFRNQWMEVTPFGDPDWTMRWTPEFIEIVDSAGTQVAERHDGRNAFDRSHGGAWDPLNLAYFSGYAMWTYHATPFVFAEPGYEVRDIEPVIDEGEALRGISVRFPDGVHTHTREQRFYFGKDGLLRRHDYEVDVWANSPAVHYLSDYVDVGGLKFPARRTVFVRNPDGTPNRDFNTVTTALADYAPV